MLEVLNLDENLIETLTVFILSMTPIVELRGAIPLAAGFGFPWYVALPLCVIGNFIPAPFIMLFIRAILKWLKRFPAFDKVIRWVERKVEKNRDKVEKYSVGGLLILVALPLPGTGAWTGALVATFLEMRMRAALPAIFFGVLIAGLVMTGVSYGFIQFLDFLK